MRLVYLGTPGVAVAPLEALHAAGHEIAMVVTGPDKRRGRGVTTSPSPVKEAAVRLGIEVTHDVDDCLEAGADLGVVVAFGQIIRPHVLAALPMINLHFSLLPRWRGAAPVERAILAGDTETGVAVMAVETGLDTGGVYAEERVEIGPATTADELRASLVQVGSRLLVDTLAVGLGDPRPQVGEVTYAAKIRSDDLRIDWTQPPEHVHRQVRVGGAWTTFRGARVKILEADLVDGALVPRVVQPEGRRPMGYEAWQNGVQPAPGEWFE